jgi:hypothetical protein
MPVPPNIYRNFTLTRTSVSAAGKFLQALVLSKGQITSVSSLCNGFHPGKIQYYSSFYRLKFWDQEALDTFHGFGYETEDIERINLNRSPTPREINNENKATRPTIKL